MLTWDDPDKRYYQHGLDRGVLYIPGKDPLVWNGLLGFEENGGGTTELLYRDGVVYLGDADPGDFTGVITALMYPEGFGVCIGFPKATDGFFVDNQKPQPFSMSYRTLIGSGSRGDMFGYQIHLVYNVMATIGQRKRNTIGKETSPVEFTFDAVCTPVKLPGYRPTAHYVIDTRGLSKSKVDELEAILYGDGVTPGQMPAPQTLYDLLNFGSAMSFVVHTDGTYTVTGSSDNLEEIDVNHFIMRNINAVDNLDGTYTVSDGGDTTVTHE